MADEVVVSLRAEGVEEVKKELRSVRELYIELERAAISSAERISDRRLAIVRRETQETKKLLRTLQAEENFGSSTGRGPRRARSALGGSAGGGTPEWNLFSGAGAGSFAVDQSSMMSAMSGAAKAAGVIGVGIMAFKAGLDLAVEGLKQFSGFLINDVIKPALALETVATQMENASGGTIRAEQVMDQTRAVQVKYNLAADKGAQVINDLADGTGRAALAMELLEPLAEMSKAYGADIGELGGLATAIAAKDPTISGQGVMGALRQIVAGGQVEGSIFSMKTLAGLQGGLFEKADKLSGSSTQKTAQLVAGLQTGGIVGKADVSLTNMNAFIQDVTNRAQKGGKLERYNLLDEAGNLKDIGAAVRASLQESGGNRAGLNKLKLSDTGGSFLGNFFSTFTDALKENGGDMNKALEEATATFEKVKAATLDEATVKQGAAAVMDTAGERWEKALNEIKDKMLVVMPAVDDFVDKIVERTPDIAEAAATLADALVGLADWLAEWMLDNRKDTSEGRQKLLNREQRDLNKAIIRGQREGIDTTALEKQKELGQAAYNEQEAALKLLSGTKADEQFRQKIGAYSTNEEENQKLLASRGAARSEYEMARLKEIEQNPYMDVKDLMKYGGGEEQLKILQDYQSKVQANMTEKIGSSLDPFLAAAKKAAEELQKVADSANEVDRSKPFTKK